MTFLITAGPTREPIDPVRFLSNRSSGKMGYAIAAAAVAEGHRAILISGPVALPPPGGVEFVSVETSDEMFDAVHAQLPRARIAVLAAAVADYKPIEVAASKWKKSAATVMLPLTPTRDILASLRPAVGARMTIVGFAAETERLLEQARRKVHAKDCDLIVANEVGPQRGFDVDENEVTLCFRDGREEIIPRMSKNALGEILVKVFVALAEKR